MNIAIPYENGSIFQHYGKTEEFKIFETQDGKIQATVLLKLLVAVTVRWQASCRTTMWMPSSAVA